MRDWILGWLLKDDAPLLELERAAEVAEAPLLVSAPNVEIKAVERSVAILREVAKAESDRETNLNGRGTAVATVAGLIVSLAAALAKPIFGDTKWTDDTKPVAAFFFALGLPVVAAAMLAAVFMVLRPQRGGRTKNFVAETVVDLWKQDPRVFAETGEKPLALLELDRALRTLPAWHYRNRYKARWLRRAYGLLAYGTLFLGVAGVLALAHYSGSDLWISLVAVAAGAVFALFALRYDWLGAVPKGREEIAEHAPDVVAAALRGGVCAVSGDDTVERR
jgi:hypothetical protein